MLATAEQHAPLLTWFAARQIEARFDYTLVDTSGFFDDAARMLGDRYELYAELIDRVRFAYRKSHTWISLELIDSEVFILKYSVMPSHGDDGNHRHEKAFA